MEEELLPRRARIDMLAPAELALRDALISVEDLGADERLTNAVTKILEAMQIVSDFVDENIETYETYEVELPSPPTLTFLPDESRGSVGITLDNNFVYKSGHGGQFKFKLPTPKYQWTIKDRKKNIVTLIDKPL